MTLGKAVAQWQRPGPLLHRADLSRRSMAKAEAQRRRMDRGGDSLSPLLTVTASPRQFVVSAHRACSSRQSGAEAKAQRRQMPRWQESGQPARAFQALRSSMNRSAGLRYGSFHISGKKRQRAGRTPPLWFPATAL